jgi:1-acyl-sn-glycerol-3-phosphate acyltransferase
MTSPNAARRAAGFMFYPISRSKLSPVVNASVMLRAAGIALMLTFFFVLGAPVQWAILRLYPRASHALPRLFYRLLLGFVKVRVRVRGVKPEEIPQLIVANHISWMDIPALGSLYPISFLAKLEVASWPVLGSFARLQRSVFVNRNKPQSVLAANLTMARLIRAGACVALFPEGTTHDGNTLGPFRSAHFGVVQDLLSLNAAQTSLRIHPVAIRYSLPHAPWCGDDLLLPHVAGLLRGASVACELIFCTPLEFEASADRKTIAEQCRNRIAAALAAAEAIS